MESMRLAWPSSVVEHVLARAQFAFIDDPLNVAVILATNKVTNFVARGLRRHRHNKKSPLVHTQDAIHDRLANLELGRVHQPHPFMARGVKGRRYNLTGRGPNSSGRPETGAGSGLPGSAHLRALDHIPLAACRSLRNFAASAWLPISQAVP